MRKFHPTPSAMLRAVSLSVCGALGSVALLSARVAQAQVSFTLTNYSSSASASSEAYFYGTISNGGTSTVYLNGLSLSQNAGTTPTSGVFTPDTSPFYTLAPASLAAGGSYTGQLFGIATSASFNGASRFYGTATLNGGATDSSADTLGMPQNFTVYALPEPATLPLAAVTLLGNGLTIVRRRSRRTGA